MLSMAVVDYPVSLLCFSDFNFIIFLVCVCKYVCVSVCVCACVPVCRY